MIYIYVYIDDVIKGISIIFFFFFFKKKKKNLHKKLIVA